jgi:hypothetical protein
MSCPGSRRKRFPNGLKPCFSESPRKNYSRIVSVPPKAHVGTPSLLRASSSCVGSWGDMVNDGPIIRGDLMVDGRVAPLPAVASSRSEVSSTFQEFARWTRRPSSLLLDSPVSIRGQRFRCRLRAPAKGWGVDVFRYCV